jgi:hypothetical protein
MEVTDQLSVLDVWPDPLLSSGTLGWWRLSFAAGLTLYHPLVPLDGGV